MPIRRKTAGVFAAVVALLLPAYPANAQDGRDSAPVAAQLSPAQLFAFADEARDLGDFETAQTAYRALMQHPEQELQKEARFRLALMLADQMGRLQDAAVLLRAILDEQPDAARVRLELARMQAQMGNFSGARRELRAAQAAGLPPAVQQAVEFYASALAARKPIGGSFQLAIAPDSNINRATQSDTLETVIGEFDLSDDAQATSGVGLSLRGQGYFRAPLGQSADLLVRANAATRFYGKDEFNDYIVSLQAGPQFTWGGERLTLAALVSHRWFGGSPYNLAYGASAEWQRPVSDTTRVTANATAIISNDTLNSLRDSKRYSLAMGVDKAFSAKFGGGLRASGYREAARDPGYSIASGGVDAYLFRELGSTTLVASIGYDHLEADERLALYSRRRVDDRFETSLSSTFRALRVGTLAPLASVRFERNKSTVELYDYKRFSVELGVTAAF